MLNMLSSVIFVFGAIGFQYSNHVITHLTEQTDCFTDHQDQFKIPVKRNQRHAYKPNKFKSNRIRTTDFRIRCVGNLRIFLTIDTYLIIIIYSLI